MSVKDLFIGGTVYRNIAWYTKGVKEFTRSAHDYLKPRLKHTHNAISKKQSNSSV